MQLPGAFTRSLQNVTGFNVESFEAVHNNGKQVTSIRLNPGKKGTVLNFAPGILTTKVPWSGEGFYLSERPSFTGDPLFHAGAYYVQEASSMFLEQVIKQTTDLSVPVKVLDLCAAPGGKSTLLQSIISKDSLLVSNEVIKSRVTVLSENITKWGAANVVVTNNDAKDFQRLPGYFDVIVIDAPCSGSGLFRKDPAAINEWSEQNVQLCSQRQQRILADVLPALKEGGILIYSTCSYSAAEDEDICDWFTEELSMETIQLKVEGQWNITETLSAKKNAFGYRFYPDKVEGEGFFIAAFKKTGNDYKSLQSSKNKLDKLSLKAIEPIKPFIKNIDEYFFILQNEDVLTLPHHLAVDILYLQANLYLKKAGVKTGTVIRNELIPDHCLAMSVIANPLIPKIEVSKDEALQYLRKQEFKIPTAIRGWSLLSFLNLPLGWVKVLPNRINNYYPKDWRILNK